MFIVDNPVTFNLQRFAEDPPATPQQDPPVAAAPSTEGLTPLAGQHNSLGDYFAAKGYNLEAPLPDTPPSAATPPAATPAPIEGGPTPQQTTVPPVQPPATDPAAQPVQPSEPILGKFKTQDDLARAYVELEKWNTQLAQRRGLPEGMDNQTNLTQLYNQQQQELQQLRGMLAAAGQQSPATGAPTVENSMTPEEFQELLYNEPAKVMQMFGEQARNEAQRLLAEEKQRQEQARLEHEGNVDFFYNQVMTARAAYPDFAGLEPQIQQFLDQNPNLGFSPNGIDIAYNAVKGKTYEPPKSHDEMLKDDNFRQKVVSNETIKQEVLKSHAEAIRNNAPPPVIGNQPGLPPATPKDEIKSTRDATNAFMGRIRTLLGGAGQ